MKSRLFSKSIIGLICFFSLLCMYVLKSNAQERKVDMKEVRMIVKQPVDKILDEAPVPEVDVKSYWKVLRKDTDRPCVAFFYSDVDGQSQRLASLIRYVAIDYGDRIRFIRIKTADKGKPKRDVAKEMERKFSLDKTPGILIYDNENGKMVLEEEEYIDADFKEFRTPTLMFWPMYYNAVYKEIKKLLLD